MKLSTSIAKERRAASMEAARTLVRLKVGQRQPIDIFKIIQEEGIWLMFQPLKAVFGAYVPQEKAVGIILNSKHPLSLQRFTAAHEFGHYILKHPLSIDDEGFIERARNSSDPHEIAADTFAAYFLMPLELVNSMLQNMGLPRAPGKLTALQAYQLALEMGVSYTATVNHLETLNKITRETASELRTVRPKDIKARIGGGLLENSWADIWVLDQSHTGKRVRMRVYDELRISLPETPSTGYVWTLAGENIADVTSEEQKALPGLARPQGILYGDHIGSKTISALSPPLALISNEFEANSGSGEHTRYGGAGNRYLTFRALLPGRYTLRLLKRRPWQMEAPPVEEFEVHLEVTPKPTGDSDQGLSTEQQSLVKVV